MINNPRDRGQIIDSMARGMALTQCYRDATSAVFTPFKGHRWRFLVLLTKSKQQWHRNWRCCLPKLQAKFDAEDAPIIAAQAALRHKQHKQNAILYCVMRLTIIKLNAEAGICLRALLLATT